MPLDLKTTPILRLFCAYFFPALVSMLVLSTYVVFDGIFVARGVGEAGLSAVGIVSPVFSFFIAIELLFGIGGGAIVGIALGQGRLFKARAVFSSVINALIILGFSAAAILFIFRRQVALLLGSSEDLLDLVLPYLGVIVLGFPIVILQSVLCTFARNDRAPRLAMLSFTLGSATNIALNYIFIFKFGWGMFGAGFSTILGHFVGLLVVLGHFFGAHTALRFSRTIRRKALNRVVRSGVSPFVTEFAFGLSVVVMNVVLMRLGGVGAVAILSVIMYVGAICFGVVLAVSHALQPIVSYSFGARDVGRVRATLKIALLFALGAGIFIYLLTFFALDSLARIFLRADSGILGATVEAGRVYFLGYLFIGVNVVVAAFLQAIERNVASIITALAHNVGLIFVFLPLLAWGFGVRGVWLSFPVALGFAAIIGGVVLKKELKQF